MIVLLGIVLIAVGILGVEDDDTWVGVLSMSLLVVGLLLCFGWVLEPAS